MPVHVRDWDDRTIEASETGCGRNIKLYLHVHVRMLQRWNFKYLHCKCEHRHRKRTARISSWKSRFAKWMHSAGRPKKRIVFIFYLSFAIRCVFFPAWLRYIVARQDLFPCLASHNFPSSGVSYSERRLSQVKTSSGHLSAAAASRIRQSGWDCLTFLSIRAADAYFRLLELSETPKILLLCAAAHSRIVSS